jgi:hypothetical protein
VIFTTAIIIANLVFFLALLVYGFWGELDHYGIKAILSLGFMFSLNAVQLYLEWLRL